MVRLFLIVIFCFLYLAGSQVHAEKNTNAVLNELNGNESVRHNLYQKIFQAKSLDYTVFKRALQGMAELKYSNSRYLTIIDFTKSSTQKRLFVVDLAAQKLVFQTLVAHGKNSGADFANAFSNQLNSLQSSPGFYRTAETYRGKHGYSLRLDGLEQGINDQARKRAIVIHGADYVSESFIHQQGRLGRSWGCPALPQQQCKAIIDLIKNGCCLYIHTNNEGYLAHSTL